MLLPTENTRTRIPLATQAMESLNDAILRPKTNKGKENKGKASVLKCTVTMAPLISSFPG